MFYLMGQIAVCLLLAALLGAAVGWLVRSINARGEIESLRRRTQIQLRDLRSRAAAVDTSAEPAAQASAEDAASREAERRDAARLQQQLRHQVGKLQALVDQRDKEISHLRRVLGEQRDSRTGSQGGQGAGH
jgi:hypothetical protein